MQAPLDGQYHRIPAGTRLPEGLRVRHDGPEVGGPSPYPTHHTIYATRPMSLGGFNDLFQSLPFEHAGKKKK